MNANFGLLDDLSERVKDKRLKRERFAERALAAMTEWRESVTLTALAAPERASA
jgi:folate-dependent tRNA-U54 methylase TrmFO/GidA